MEAISHAGTCLGILANDGILLAAERRNTNKLLDEVFFSEKIYKLNESVDSLFLLFRIKSLFPLIIPFGLLTESLFSNILYKTTQRLLDLTPHKMPDSSLTLIDTN